MRLNPPSYSVAVVPPASTLWPHERNVVVFDEPKRGAALVRLHDLLIEPETQVPGMKVFLQSAGQTIVEYTFKGCRRGWEKKLA